MAVDLKAAAPDTTLVAGAVLFGADSQAAAAPSVYALDTTIANYLASLAQTLSNKLFSTGVGYSAGTGVGGAVTQATSKATGVTLNTLCGQITLNGATLTGSTSVAFVLTNSTIAATDTVDVSIASGATTNSYQLQVEAVAAGSCRISLRNTTVATALSEAIVVNFGVNKRVTT